MMNNTWTSEREDELLDFMPALFAKTISRSEIANHFGIDPAAISQKIGKMLTATKAKREAKKALYLERFEDNLDKQKSGTNIIIIQGIKLAKRICVICARPFSIEACNSKMTDCYYCNDLWRKAEGKETESGWKSMMAKSHFGRKIQSSRKKETGVDYYESA